MKFVKFLRTPILKNITGANAGFEFGRHKVVTRFSDTKIVRTAQSMIPPRLVAMKILISRRPKTFHFRACFA